MEWEQPLPLEKEPTITPQRPTDPTESRSGRQPRPRIAVVGLNYSPEQTGIAVYTSGAARALSESGHTVSVLTGYPHYPQWRVHAGYSGWSRSEVVDGVRVRRLRHYVPVRPRLVNRVVMELTFGLRTIATSWDRPDAVILVSPGLFSTALALLRARAQRLPAIVWVQDLYSLGLAETGRGGPAARVVRALERRVLRSADRVIVIHDRFRRVLTETLDVRPDRIDVVRNWSHVDLSHTRDRETVRAERGWTDDIVVLHAGNMGAKQGLENVVAASRLAADAGSRIRFVLLGDGNQRAHLESLGGNSRLEFVGSLPSGEFESVLCSADILLVNERAGVAEHAVPSKMTTYFASGLPVIASTDAQGITAEEVRSARAGVVVDADSPAQLLDAAERIAADADGAAQFGRNGQAFVHRHLTVAAARERLTSVVASVASGVRRKG